MGWDEVLSALENAPFCEEHGRIVNVLFSKKCGTCTRNGLCAVCIENGVYHFLGYPVFDESEYDESFQQLW